MPAEQLSQLLRTLRQRPPRIEVQVQSRWQLGDTLLDAWLFLSAVAGLLGLQWYLRKKWGLV